MRELFIVCENWNVEEEEEEEEIFDGIFFLGGDKREADKKWLRERERKRNEQI